MINILVNFHVYEFGTWNNADRILLTLGSMDIDLGIFHQQNDHVIRGLVNGVSWTRQALDVLSDTARIHEVSVYIPQESLASPGKLSVTFWFDLTDSITTKSGGIDNMNVVTFSGCNPEQQHPQHEMSNHHFGMSNLPLGHGSNTKALRYQYVPSTDSSRGRAASPTSAYKNAPVDEPSMDGSEEDDYEESGPHCTVKDFPCEGGTQAYICHYSVFKGYNTYCVNEEDTDVIRFYPK